MIVFLIAGAIAALFIALYSTRQQRTVSGIMAQNKNVMPLLKQKASELAAVHANKSAVNGLPPKRKA